MPDTFHSRVLKRAAEALGGTDQLRVRLGVTSAQLKRWMDGEATPPDGIFLRVADMLADERLQELRGRRTGQP